jgi:hypothetical protein
LRSLPSGKRRSSDMARRKKKNLVDWRGSEAWGVGPDPVQLDGNPLLMVQSIE